MDEKDMMTVELDDFKGAVSSTEKALKEQGDLAQEAVDNMQNSVEEALAKAYLAMLCEDYIYTQQTLRRPFQSQRTKRFVYKWRDNTRSAKKRPYRCQI